MENKNTDSSFQYTYSAKEQDEIRRIREKYQSKEEDGICKLRKMDARVSQKATVVSLVLGILGALVMGTGMSLVMTDIGHKIGMGDAMIPGIVIGVVGMLMAIVNYPIYKKLLGSRKQKYAKEIIELSERILEEN